MINEETKRKLRELNVGEMITILDLQQRDSQSALLSFDERFQQITDYLYQEKYNSKIHRLLKLSQLRLPRADVYDIFYTNRGIERSVIQELSTCQFINQHSNVIFQGFTGSGKTFLACALGKEACKHQIRTKYVRLPDLLVEHDEASLTLRSNTKLLKKYSRFELLILDEWLLEDISQQEECCLCICNNNYTAQNIHILLFFRSYLTVTFNNG